MILSCQSICKSFGEKVILQDASFHIEEREKAALIGNNGAGKTTLLRIIMEDDHQAVHFGYGGQDPFSGAGNEIRSRRQT